MLFRLIVSIVETNDFFDHKLLMKIAEYPFYKEIIKGKKHPQTESSPERE